MNSNQQLIPNANSIAVYTILSILRQMKETLGLEAMLEYVEKYPQVIEANNPEIKSAVQHTLSLMSIDSLYRKGTKN